MPYNNKCIGLERLFGHKFEPRFNTTPSTSTFVASTDTAIKIMADVTTLIAEKITHEGDCDVLSSLEDVQEEFIRGVSMPRNQIHSQTVYLHDVCIRCGLIITNR